jgi:hypothetical protein
MTEAGGWDIGGYDPVGYGVTPWEVLFPALGASTSRFPKTLLSIYAAKLFTYYLTRLQFGQYLRFLSDVGGANCKNDAVEADTAFYADHCDQLYQTITNTIATGAVTKDGYEAVVKGNETSLATASQPKPEVKFYSQTVYSTFWTHYNTLCSFAYGLIEVREDITKDGNLIPGAYLSTSGPKPVLDKDGKEIAGKYLSTSGYKPAPNEPFTLLPMLEDSLRLYPVIARDGNCSTFIYDDAKGWVARGWGWNVQEYGHSLLDERSGKNAGGGYGRIHSAHGHSRFGSFPFIRLPVSGLGMGRYYFVGLDTVPDNYAGKIRGLPVLYRMPFEFLASYADPSKPALA